MYALVKRYLKKKKQENFVYRKISCESTAPATERVSVVVTGGSGCLGQCLIEKLVNAGEYAVHSLDLVVPEYMIPGITSYIKADITNKNDLQFAFKAARPEVVFHVAGLIPTVKTKDSDLFKVNSTGTKNVIEACKQFNVKRLIYTSTCDVLMSKEKDQVLDMADESFPYPDNPLNPYCASKIEGEKAILAANCESLSTCVMRCSTIGSYNSAMFNALLTNQAYYVGDGTNKQCLVEVNTCATGHLLADKGLRENNSLVSGQVYHLSGDAYKVKDLLGHTIDDSGYTVWGYSPPRSIPKWIASFAAFFNVLTFSLTGYCPIDLYFNSYAVEFCSRSYTFSGNKARRDLGWEEHPPWQEVALNIADNYMNKKHK